MSDSESRTVLKLTAQIVAAYVGKSRMANDALPPLIEAVYQSLATVGTPAPPAAAPMPTPAVPVRKSVFPDHIICLEDGKKLKMLKRYLRNRYGLTPDQYRLRWNLPADYPLVAPDYTRRRSDLAKSIGLGRKKPAEPPVTVGRARQARGLKG